VKIGTGKTRYALPMDFSSNTMTWANLSVTEQQKPSHFKKSHDTKGVDNKRKKQEIVLCTSKDSINRVKATRRMLTPSTQQKNLIQIWKRTCFKYGKGLVFSPKTYK
jgi:hypothetical protein